MNDDTIEFPKVRTAAQAPIMASAPATHAADGTDPHPVSAEELIGRIDAHLDTVWAHAELRGYLAGAESFLAEVHELVTLAQSLEGQATERAEMLRSTAAAALGDQEDAYEALMDRIHGEVA